MASSSDQAPLLPGSLRARLAAWLRGLLGHALMAACLAAGVSLLTWSASDPSYIRTASGPIRNALGAAGANVSDLAMRLFGLSAVFILLPPTFWALELITRRQLEDARMKLTLAPVAVLLLACAVSALPIPSAWPLPYGLGGLLGEQSLRFLASLAMTAAPEYATAAVGALCLLGGAILLTGSLGMSLQDLKLICRGQGGRSSLATRAWRGLGRAFERPVPPLFDRREPTFDVPQGAMTVGRRPFPAEPALGYEPSLGRPGGRGATPSGKRTSWRRQTRDPEFDQTTETRSRAMAQRFAPSRDEPAGPMGLGFLWRRGGETQTRAGQRRSPTARSRSAEGRPIWPGSMPVPAEEEAAPAEEEDVPAVELGMRSHAVGDDLYRRAVALVRAQRRASAAYLQQSLGIGYMRAADLIDRMEREGVVGAPIHNGIRPILTPPPGTRIV